MRHASWILSLAGLAFVTSGVARASVTVLLEEPFGHFGGMNPTGHAALYLSDVCAASPTALRPCRTGEEGVVISRYHRVDGYDWLAIPLTPYLYAVDRPDQAPTTATAEEVAELRDAYRRAHLESVAPDLPGGGTPTGDWTQLIGAAYDRTIYAFGLPTTEERDEEFIRRYNARTNQEHFNILFHNCSDFVRHAVDFYYPHAIHRSFIADVGIMTPKQAAKSFVSYSKHHRDLEFTTFAIPQVPGSIPRSTRVRGVLESLVKSKRYAVPLVGLAILHPVIGGSMAFAWLDGSRFDPRRVAEPGEVYAKSAYTKPAMVAAKLESSIAVGVGAAQ